MFKKHVRFILFYFLFWYAIFFTGKVLFLLYHFSKTSELSIKIIPGIFYHGLKLDFSAIGYLLVLPAFVLLVSSPFKQRIEYFILKGYTVILVSVVVFLLLIDMELYRHWGFRLDKTPLNYIKNPEDMLASIPWLTIFIGLLFTITISFGFIYLYNKYIGSILKHKTGRSFGSFFFFLFFLPALFIPIRGGFDTSPINHSSAFFSNITFANHSAINVIWNLGHSFTEDENTDKYRFFTEKEAKKNVDELIEGEYKGEKILTVTQPDILLIILESFTAKTIESLGGMKDVTPGFNQLADSGILFSNFYSIADRSDKGICAILSGFPAFGTTSVLKYPEKFEKLPSISESLVENGYHTSFYYGGDINFFNFKAYFLNKGFQKLISKSDFPSKYNTSKWGVPDEYVFEKLYSEIETSETPFFKALFTLSSHEPFDIPAKPHFQGTGKLNDFINSAHYTDSCLFSFMQKLQKSDKWKNMLVVIMADHGTIYLDDLAYYDERNYHIPMLWTGGTVKKDTIVAKYGYQLDFPKTLLNQLNLSTDSFAYGKDLLNENTPGFAYYAFNDGFGFLNDSVEFLFDYRSGTLIGIEDENNRFVIQGKSLLQVSYNDFLLK